VKLVKKECFNRWYGLFPYYLALTLSRLPVQLLLNIVFTLLVYWLSGLPPELFRYCLFALVGIIVSLCAEGFGLMIGATFNVMVRRDGFTTVLHKFSRFSLSFFRTVPLSDH